MEPYSGANSLRVPQSRITESVLTEADLVKHPATARRRIKLPSSPFTTLAKKQQVIVLRGVNIVKYKSTWKPQRMQL